MVEGHEERIREAFTRQASTFEDERLNIAFTAGLPWLLAYVDPQPDDVVLDVAAGTGIVSRALAPGVARVMAVDSTEAMVEEGRRRATAEGRHNVDFVLGSAEDLPFGDSVFSLVVTRFSLHHFADPTPALRAMARVLAPGGRLVVKDLVADTDPTVAERQDHLERLRDPSHVRMPPGGSVGTWLERQGLAVTAVAQREIDRPVEQWLRQAVTGEAAADQVRAAFEADVAGGETTGLRPHRHNDELWFHQTWEVTVAHKA